MKRGGVDHSMYMMMMEVAPIRHKGFSAHVDGVGAALAMDFERDDVRQKVADFINGRYIGGLDVAAGADAL